MDASEIKEIRKKYGLSAGGMSAVCGFGINQWRNYENGMQPARSNLLLIELIKDERNFANLVVLQDDKIPSVQRGKAYQFIENLKQ